MKTEEQIRQKLATMNDQQEKAIHGRAHVDPKTARFVIEAIEATLAWVLTEPEDPRSIADILIEMERR